MRGAGGSPAKTDRGIPEDISIERQHLPIDPHCGHSLHHTGKPRKTGGIGIDAPTHRLSRPSNARSTSRHHVPHRLLSPRVAILMDGLQPRMVDVCVDLGGANIGVPQHFLQRPNIGAAGQHVCGKTVP